MAIAFDVASNAAGDDDSSISWSHTCTGSDLILIVGISIQDATPGTVSGITYAGAALTNIAGATITNGTRRTEIWYKINPATGANTIAVTFTEVIAGPVGGAVSLTGVDQTNPIDASQSASGSSTTPSLSITTVADSSWIVDTVTTAGTLTMTAATGRTQRWNRLDDFGENPRAGGSTQGAISPAGATTMEWTANNTTWAMGAVSLAPAAGGPEAPSIVGWKTLLGVGQALFLLLLKPLFDKLNYFN